MARVIQVIESVICRGEGVKESPMRSVTQYWSFDGVLLAENDPWKTELERKEDGENKV